MSDCNITLLYIRAVTVMVLKHYNLKYQRRDCGNCGGANTINRYVMFTAIDIPRHTTKPYPKHSLPAEYQELNKNLNITLSLDMQHGTFVSVYQKTGRNSSVGIATRYGLDGPGIKSQLGRDFPHPSRPAPRPTQPPI